MAIPLIPLLVTAGAAGITADTMRGGKGGKEFLNKFIKRQTKNPSEELYTDEAIPGFKLPEPDTIKTQFGGFS